MKKVYRNGSKKYVVLALLSVLFVSLGFLSMQGIREGMKEGAKFEEGKTEDNVKKVLNLILGSA